LPINLKHANGRARSRHAGMRRGAPGRSAASGAIVASKTSPEAKKLMLKSADPTISPRRLRLPAHLAVVLALGAQCGCTREFFREWANQDATEAIFEKSRDPRWRIDMFSIEPPALARYTDYSNPDNPPAPPDDYATEAMSPVPQWPDNRLLSPMEGTGYL